MSELLTLLKIAGISGILFGWYSIFLRNRRMHWYNRFFLLAATVASIVMPAIEIPVSYVEASKHTTVSRAISVINSPGNEIISSAASARALQWTDMLIIGYLFVVLVLLSRMVAQVIRLHTARRRSGRYKMHGVTIVPTDLPSAPFSFIHLVYWNAATDINSAAGQRILEHELVHIRQGHTWDKLFMQVACSIFWPVPFFWMMKKELSLVHEFLADESSIKDNDTAALAEMLLHSTIGYNSAITNTFYSSPIKRRIIMMTKKNKFTRYRTLRMLSVLPIVAAALVLTSFRFTPVHTNTIHKMTVVLDAGHGGNDAGASHNGITEKDLNLKIVNKLATLAGDYDIDVVKTRSGDNYPTLSQRVDISNATKADVFVSIHVNQESKDNKVAGDYLVYVSQANKQYGQSTKLATAIANSMSAYKPQVVNKGLLVLKANDHPAVLIECGNMDKEEQLALLQNDTKLETLCRNILSGIVSFKN